MNWTEATKISDRLFRLEPRPSFDSQLEALPPDVRSVVESLALRNMESANGDLSLIHSDGFGNG